MKTILALTAFLFTSAAAQAADTIEFIAPGKPGGNVVYYSQLMSDQLTERGIKTDFKAVGNCAVAKKIYQDATNPLIMHWFNFAEVNNPSCEMGAAGRDVLQHVYSGPNYVCTPGSEKDYKSVFKAGQTYVMGFAAGDTRQKGILEQLAKDLNVTFRIIQYENTGMVKTAMVNGEIQHIFASNGMEMQQQGLATCTINSSTKDISNTVSLAKVSPTNIGIGLESNNWIIAKNLSDAQKTNLIKELKAIASGPAYAKAISDKGYLIDVSDIADQIAHVKNSIDSLSKN